MAWTVAFALLGAVIFSMTIAPRFGSLCNTPNRHR
jgi:Cu/Ag efflux pump CusA